MLPEQIGAAFRVPAFLVAVGVEHRDQIVELAPAQRVMHEMGARAGPQHHVGPPQVRRHLVALEHGAIGDVAGHPRLAVADDALAHLRPHAVAADQRAAFGPFAVFERDHDAVAVLLEAVDAPAGLQRDQVAALAGFQERAVDVGAMGDRVGLAEALEEGRRRAECG